MTHLIDFALSKKCDMTVEEMFEHYSRYMPGAGSCGEWLIQIDPWPMAGSMDIGAPIVKRVLLHNRETGERHAREF